MKVLVVTNVDEGYFVCLADGVETGVEYLFKEEIGDSLLGDIAERIEYTFKVVKEKKREELKSFLMTKTVDEINDVFIDWFWFHEEEILTKESF
ncbi:MAG: hypothetical protein MJ212_05590 [Alphaproteobacteria bacterium]|nr:hypothetical protein [Alphaproteobacteria bacterium]